MSATSMTPDEILRLIASEQSNRGSTDVRLADVATVRRRVRP
jgi:multidrug efflux pump subunit AcrB